VARIERPGSGRAWGPVLGRVDGQPSPLDLAIVKELDRRGRLGLGGELDERESPGPPRLAIRGQIDLDDAASFGEERGQSICGGAEGEIPDEDAGCDGWCPPVLVRVWSFRSPAMAVQYASRRASRTAAAARISSANTSTWSGQGGAFASTYWQVRLVALDEVVSRLHQTVQPCQPDEHELRHDGTPELAGTT
jgi:hypothetical protein